MAGEREREKKKREKDKRTIKREKERRIYLKGVKDVSKDRQVRVKG